MIELVKVEDKILGNLKAHDLLLENVDSTTLLVLSGGTSPDYDKIIVHPRDILPAAVCIGDERFGGPYHKDSNELLLKNFGLNDFLQVKNIDYHRILQGEGAEKTAQDYNKVLTELFAKFPKRLGVMGVGTNLHTSAIFPNSTAAKSADFIVGEHVEDRIPMRITLTLKALGQFTGFIILMFGEQKKDALVKLLDESENDMQTYPAIFYRKCLQKAYLITDIKI